MLANGAPVLDRMFGIFYLQNFFEKKIALNGILFVKGQPFLLIQWSVAINLTLYLIIAGIMESVVSFDGGREECQAQILHAQQKSAAKPSICLR